LSVGFSTHSIKNHIFDRLRIRAQIVTNVRHTPDGGTSEVAWTLTMSPAPSPMAITKKPDGSTDKIYAQNTRHGFVAIDFDTHVQTNFISLPDSPAAQQNPFGGVSHGMAITSDQKTLVINSSKNSTLHAYSLPDLKLLGGAALGGKGANWVTISPDDKRAYVANPQTNDVSVVDIKPLKEVARVPVGFAPSRNTAWLAPARDDRLHHAGGLPAN
jgi:YVTN family beta-propeller protein